MAASLCARLTLASPLTLSSSLNLNPLCFPKSTHISLNSHLSQSPLPLLSSKRITFKSFSAVQETLEEPAITTTTEDEKKKKLFIVNLPWSLSFTDIKNLFGQVGTVKDVEIIKAKDGKHKGYAFIEMATADEAQAVLEKFDSYEVSGRIIRVEYAKRLKKPPPPPPVGTPVIETRHKLYVSNLSWKVRSTDLREFFSAEFTPVSARVIFDRPSGGSAGYGFVSFATKEEAESAISSLDGKELMGRPLRIKFSDKNVDGSGNEVDKNASSTQEDDNESS
ncbi:hypothetical protein ACHQM5_007660 [Ranunculus cassubicifolius]